MKYFKESLQLYLPPAPMLNRDFLRKVLKGEKRLLPLKDLRAIVVPKFDELAVVKVYPLMQPNDAFMAYFPDKLPKGRAVSREYFWNVLNTLDEAYVAHLVAHANSVRYSAKQAEDQVQSIAVTDEWAELLLANPYLSCK